MSLKLTALLGVALCSMVSGHAISEQKIVKYYGKLGHIGDKVPEHHEEYAHAYPAYEFSYKVEDSHTHDFKGQEESRDGDVVKGLYWLIQPDGRKRTVTYHADKHSGFKALVEYSEPPHHERNENIEHQPIVEYKPILEHKPIVEYKQILEHKPIVEHKQEYRSHVEPYENQIELELPKEEIEHEPYLEHVELLKEKIERKPILEHIKLPKPHIETVELPKSRIEHEPVYEHKSIAEEEEIYERKPIYVREPEYEPRRKSHVPVPLLSAYTPRFPKTIENYYHPRDNRRPH